MKRLIGSIIAVLALVALVAAGAGWYVRRDTGPVAYQTVPVKRGELMAVIGATGTVEPEEVVDVGAQVAGQIDRFGKDATGKSVDYGSPVEADMLLAHIDDSLYNADLASATAQEESAKANVQKSMADREQMKAKLEQAQRDWERAQKVGASEALAQSTYDAYKAAYDAARANVGVAEAEVVQAEKGVIQADAVVMRANRNLGYCTIKSPVKGVIIDRRVNIGQTVVSSLNAPSLFLIAKDLKKVQVWASVNEADIGNIRPGQSATFTVDAFPSRTFQGTVGKVRLNATMTQNVVTYTVEVNADNEDGTLLPYLTANVTFQVAKREDVLLVPNAALRWAPASPELISPDARASMEEGKGKKKRGGGGGGEGGGASASAEGGGGGGERRGGGKGEGKAGGARSGGEQHRGTMYVEDGQYVRPIKVRLGLTDGINTEVSGEGVEEGMRVITGEARPGDTVATDDAKNPFAPSFKKRR